MGDAKNDEKYGGAGLRARRHLEGMGRGRPLAQHRRDAGATGFQNFSKPELADVKRAVS